MEDTLDITTKEGLEKVIKQLSKNDEILEERLNRMFEPLYSKIADLDYKLEIFARMQEKMMMKNSESTKEYVQKITVDQYKNIAKKCSEELATIIELANHYEKKDN